MYQLSLHHTHISGDGDSIADTLLIHGTGCLSVTRKHQLILTNHLKILTFLCFIKLSEIYSKLLSGVKIDPWGKDVHKILVILQKHAVSVLIKEQCFTLRTNIENQLC